MSDLLWVRPRGLGVAISGHWTTTKVGKRILGLFTIRHLLLFSQHLDQRGQVFFANSRRDGALEDA